MNSPTTRCGPRPRHEHLADLRPAVRNSAPSRAVRRVSSATGSAKKRNGRGRTRTWCAGFIDACRRRTRTTLPITPTRWSTPNARSKPASPSGFRPELRSELDEHLLDETVDAGRDGGSSGSGSSSQAAIPPNANRLLDRLEHLQHLDFPGGPLPRCPRAQRRDCSQLASWLTEAGCTHVAMEAIPTTATVPTMRLEDLRPNSAVRGVHPDGMVTVVSVQWFGSAALELTYKTPFGTVANELLYRHDEARIEVVAEGRPWSFDGDGALFRLVSEAQRIRLAHLFDPLLAVHTSVVDPLPHQITGVYEAMLPRQPLRFLLPTTRAPARPSWRGCSSRS